LPFSDPYHCLSSIYESIVAVEDFIEGMTFEGFCAEEKTVAAVERKLSVISEAAVRLGDEGPRLCPDVPWRNVRGSATGCGISTTGSTAKPFGRQWSAICPK
jgi:uncharacterized protein with HEPN domain